ncbi:alkaline phosphatase D family protein [Archangium sp.]|uniref:alkaline phosphatase D family protein n=1 Tax=Archangium sp. TaxID=1872627 RepID=UPI00389A7BC3
MTKNSVRNVLLGAVGAIGLVAPTAAQAFASPLVRVPFVGRAYQTGASIWVGTSATFGDSSTETLTLRAREATACDTCWVSTVQMTSTGTGAGFRSWKGVVEGLKANTKYHYGIFAAGYTGERGGFYFTTEPDGPSRFKVGAASCMSGANQPSQPSWDIMYEQLNTGEPNLVLLAGDNMYTPRDVTLTNDVYWSKYFEQRAVPEFTNVFRAFPTFATWDDHDYGPNDEDGTFARKDIARAAYASVYPHPPFAGDGIYHKFTWGGDASAVGGAEFFMMDDRWGRDCPVPLPTGYAPSMYGATQFSWLKSSLLASKATFKVIVNGSVLGSTSTGCWGTQRKALFDYITANKIGGVIFVTGDIHRSVVSQRTPTGGYPLYELTSSGIGVNADPAEYSFGIMEFDTTLADPTVTFKVINNPLKASTITGSGVTVSTTVVKRSQLQN